VNGKLTKSSVGVHYGSIMVNSVEHMVYYNANTSLLPSPNYYRFSEGILYDVTDSGENFDNITFESTGFKYSFDESVIENVFSSASSGTCGENLTYTLDDEGTLIISGTGNMTDFNFGKVPWNSSRESIKKVIIEDGATSICSFAFYNCINLESITIPYGVTKIGEEAFSGCESLISIILPDSLTYIGGYSFNYCINLEEVIIPESVTYIADAAFCSCTNLKKVKLPNNVSIINIATFVQCKNLTSITIPDTVKEIDQRAFMGCESLEKITILNRECEIYDFDDNGATISNGFKNDKFYFDGTICGYENSTAQTYAEKYNYKFIALDEIETTTTTSTTTTQTTTTSTITTTTTTTPPDTGEIKSGTCGANVTWVLDANGTLTISGTGDMLYDDWGTSIKKVIIEEGVTSISGLAFVDCISLTSITIPDSITRIGGFAFEGCTNLTSITIPNSVTSIGNFAFKDCTGLTSITIPDSVTSVGYNAFQDCSSLKSITILNPDCEIYDNSETISNGKDENYKHYFNGTIYGYENSTAQAYAEKYGYKFELLSNAPSDEVKSGDADGDGEVNINDAVFIMQSIANPDKYTLTEQGKANADVVDNGGGITNADALAIQYVESKTINASDFPITSEELDKLGQ
ncbi:MAG: leucine-rich repeat protein, partial [Ruminococcus sp.]|nr:leucine-rich repeat protein [Ruminococcus sp.]